MSNTTVLTLSVIPLGQLIACSHVIHGIPVVSCNKLTCVQAHSVLLI